MKPPKDRVDADLEAFFQAQRQGDLRDAPSFESMTSSVAPRPRRPRRAQIVIATALVAAASLALTISLRADAESVDRLRPIDMSADTTSGIASQTDLATDRSPESNIDDLCNAVLAALDEHEEDAAMRTPTDSLLLPGD